MIYKIDYYMAALIGFLVGIFAIPTLLNLGLRDKIILILLPPALALLWVFGMWLGKFLSRWLLFFAQLSKFAAVGFLNTAIDFGVLNILSIITGITAGFIVGGVNIPGFGLAVINSYFWNKFWVFKDREKESIFHDFPKFLGVTVVGLVLNTAIIIGVTTYIPPFFVVSSGTWLNIAKALATGVALFWNFVGYKFLVFRSQEQFPR